jgi:alpha-glucuronidase
MCGYSCRKIVAIAALAAALGSSLQAETGRQAWLRYAPPSQNTGEERGHGRETILDADDSALLKSAHQELARGLESLLGPAGRGSDRLPGTILLGTTSRLAAYRPPSGIGQDGFWLSTQKCQQSECLVIAGGSDRAVLYGVFALLSKMARGDSVSALNEVDQPGASIRWVDQWDNLDGSIERGYAGRSIFFDGGSVRGDLTRAAEYARLLASVGINGCNVNNVNANPKALTSDFLPQIARIADAFRPWGVRLSLSVDLSSPQTVGSLDTFDPLDPKVAAWWKAKADEIYKLIPDFGGITVKADSEGRLGPSFYGRTPADAANVIAQALAAHGGVVFYRAFVYNHHLDWRDPLNDRAKAAYDNFHPLDGKFDDNVVIQIKHGPIDFQAREPVSPLFSGLEKTNEAVELQVTQEYTGQQRHLVFLAPMWKEVLDFDLHAGVGHTPVKDLVAGRVFHRPAGGYVAVVNVGTDENWLAHPFAMANLYAFGRLAWNPDLSARGIAEEWSRLTFGNDPAVVKTVSEIALASWPAYEGYTGPLGAQTLTDILGSHYGPGIESSEENGWGQWHRADHEAIGMDRSVATGTGFAGQYRQPVASMYESLATTPDELVLFFHHVPYTYVLHSGKTVIQHIYDSHYQGASQVEEFIRAWKTLAGRIDGPRYQDVLTRLEYQAGHAIVWRDAVCNYFLRLSGIADAKGRAGHFPGRVEAESMELNGYVPVEITPWEDASGGKAITCPDPQGCSAVFRFSGPAGTYEMDVQYFDLREGQARYRVLVNNRTVDAWAADDHLPATKLGGDSSTRRRIRGVPLKPGDEIRIEGVPDGSEQAPVDYLEIFAERN